MVPFMVLEQCLLGETEEYNEKPQPQASGVKNMKQKPPDYEARLLTTTP